MFRKILLPTYNYICNFVTEKKLQTIYHFLMRLKNLLIPIVIFLILITAACKKSSTPPESGTGSALKFTSLAAADTVIKVNGITTITAVATGDDLTYKWTASYGTFIGSGATVQWTVCHQARFTIHCEVRDRYNNAETKSIIVTALN